MDPAVALVQAYLQMNGYFTVTEYAVMEAAGRSGQYRTSTDLNVLAVRFPGAGHAVVRRRHRRPKDPTVHAYDMGTGRTLAWISYWNYGDDCPISHHLAAFPSPDPYKGFEFINSNQGGKNLLMWGIPTPVTEPGEGFKIYRVKYDGQQMGVVENVSKTTGLGLGVHTTIAPDAKSYAVADGQKDVLAIFDRTTSKVLAAYFFDWEGRDKDLKGTWVGGGTMTIKRIYPDPKTTKFDLEGTKGIKMDWEMPPGGELQVEEGKIPGARLTNAVGCDGVVFDPRGRWAVASIRLLGLSLVLDRRNEYEPVAALHTPKGAQLHYDVVSAGKDTWRVTMDRVVSPAHEAGFSPSGDEYVAMNNLRQNNVAVIDARDADPRQWKIKTHIEHPAWKGRMPIPFHVAFNPDGTNMTALCSSYGSSPQFGFPFSAFVGGVVAGLVVGASFGDFIR